MLTFGCGPSRKGERNAAGERWRKRNERYRRRAEIAIAVFSLVTTCTRGVYEEEPF